MGEYSVRRNVVSAKGDQFKVVAVRLASQKAYHDECISSEVGVVDRQKDLDNWKSATYIDAWSVSIQACSIYSTSLISVGLIANPVTS
jgi:hypothetical protein